MKWWVTICTIAGENSLLHYCVYYQKTRPNARVGRQVFIENPILLSHMSFSFFRRFFLFTKRKKRQKRNPYASARSRLRQRPER